MSHFKNFRYYMLIKWCVPLVGALCLVASCVLPAPVRVQRQQEYYVGGKPVSEESYRAARFYNDALPLIDANRLADARVKLTAAVRLAPDFYDAHYNLGLVLIKLGREQDAVEHFRTVVIAKADVPNAWVSLGAVYINTGKHNEAITVFTDAVSRFPPTTWQQLPEFYYNYGIALGQIGRTEEGIEKLKLAVRAKAELPLAWMNLGAFYQSSGKIEQSIEHYREFIKRSPNDPDIPIVVDTIKLMEAELRVANKIQVRSDEEYYAEVTVAQPNTWPRKAMPFGCIFVPVTGCRDSNADSRKFLKLRFKSGSALQQEKLT